jgi:hypothetical protein
MLTDSIDFGYGPKNIQKFRGNKRKSVSDLGKLKLLNNDLITSASTGFFFRIGLFNNLLEASTMLRTKSESHGSSKLARLCAHLIQVL